MKEQNLGSFLSGPSGLASWVGLCVVGGWLTKAGKMMLLESFSWRSAVTAVWGTLGVVATVLMKAGTKTGFVVCSSLSCGNATLGTCSSTESPVAECNGS